MDLSETVSMALFSALCSLAIPLGPSNFMRSTALVLAETVTVGVLVLPADFSREAPVM
jgi:hypothetical protein